MAADKKTKDQTVSIERITGRLFIFSLLNFLVILVAVVLITVTSTLSNRMESSSRDVLLSINHLIILLNDQKNRAGEASPSAEMREIAEKISREIGGLTDSIRQSREFPLPEYGSVEEREVYYSSIVDFVKMVRDNMDRSLSNSFLIIRIQFILAACFSVINMWEHVKWKKYNLRFMSDIRTGLTDLDYILRSREPALDYDTPVKESQHFFNYVKIINRNIDFNNRIRDLSVFGSLDDIIHYIYSLISLRMRCDRIALAFVDEERNVIAETFYSVYSNYFLEQGYTLPLNQTTLGQVADSKSYRIINDLPDYYRTRKESRSTPKLLKEGLKSSLTLPIYFQEKCVGFVFISSRTRNSYEREQAEYAKRITDLLKQKLYIEYILQNVIADTSQSFVTLMNKKDNETAEHISRMSRYSYILAKKYSEKYKHLSPKFIREILWYSPLHDIGKVGIPDSILLKEGSLSKEEMDKMKEHVVIGEKVIEEINRRMSRSFPYPP